MRLAEFGARQPVTNLMIFLAILVLGLVSFTRLPVDLMPEIERPTISVITGYEGASSLDVEKKITEVIEKSLASVANLDRITSRSLEGVSVVSCRFKWGINLDEASNEVRDKLELAKRSLPDDISTPIVFKFNTAMIPILFIGIHGPAQLYGKLYHIVDRDVVKNLERVPGVGAVQIYGGLERQININIDRGRLEAYGIAVQQIVERLAQENINLPAGNLKVGYIDYTLRMPQEFYSVKQMEEIIIGKYSDKIVYLKDVAEVSDSFKEVNMVARINSQPALMLAVQKRSGANTVEVAERVKKEIERLRNTLEYPLEFSFLLDTSQHIRQSLSDLGKNAWGGIFLVVLIVFLFLRRLYPSLIIVTTIPFSLIIAFIFMYFFGYTINIISLSSLAMALGMVVDNAIVVVENIFRYRQAGRKPKEAAVFGASEVGLAISASTLTTIIVFFPLVFVSGVEGIMFKQLAVIVTITLLASLFTALTFSVSLAANWLGGPLKERARKNKIWERVDKVSSLFLEKIEGFYSSLLHWALSHKTLVVIFVGVIFILSLGLFLKVGQEFIPEEDTGDLNIQVELGVGTRFEETDKIAQKIEDILREEVPEATAIFSRVGQAGSARMAVGFGQRLGPHIAMVGVKLLKVSERKRSVKEIASSLRPRLTQLLGVKRLNIQTGSPFARILFGGEKPISVEILGYDLETTDRIAQLLREKILQVKGVVDVGISRELGRPELQIEVDRLKASSLGLSMANIAETLRTYFYGKTATKYREGGEEYDIFVRLKESDRLSVQDIESIPLASLDGKIVPLKNIAKITQRRGPIEIERQNQQRIVKVEANISARSLSEVVKDIKGIVEKIQFPPQIRVGLAGDVEELTKSFRNLFLLFMLGILLVYMVMASQFESLLDPFIILFSIPFAFSGVSFSLFLAGITFNIVSFVGLIMLVGIVVNNAIVLISYINILCKRGFPLREAITRAGKERLRPVLMTTLTTLGAMLPLALIRAEGSELWQPLGVSMLGGLSVSTFITLILIPTLYFVFHRKRLIRLKA